MTSSSPPPPTPTTDPEDPWAKYPRDEHGRPPAGYKVVDSKERVVEVRLIEEREGEIYSKLYAHFLHRPRAPAPWRREYFYEVPADEVERQQTLYTATPPTAGAAGAEDA